MLKHEDGTPASLSAARDVRSFWYLASCYRNWPEGIEAGFIAASRAAAWLAKNEVPVFCPISHGHPMSTFGGIPVDDHEFWMNLDAPFMKAASGLIIYKPHHALSDGITEERCKMRRKPLLFLEWT